MVISMFPLVVRVLTPFYWTEGGFTREHFEEGRFSIGSFLPFRPPSRTPLVPHHRLLSHPHHPSPNPPPPPPSSVRSASLKLQKRLSVLVLKYEHRKIWIDPHEINEISLTKSRRNVTRLHRGGLIIKKPFVIHLRDMVSLRNEAKMKVRHTGKSLDRLAYHG